MIDKNKCSGCSACENICPTNAITLKVDTLTGFKLAEIDNDKCINCSKCYRVCPHNTVNLHDLSNQKKYALKSLDEDVLKKSSSGGAFTHITLPLLERGWKVVGVRWNKEWHAEYAIAETIEDWEKFRKSKYMQADMGDLFPRIKNMLDDGENIVFSGVPCHVSGLLNYLGKEYNNLLTIDLLCNSMVSPKIWDMWYEYEGLDKSTFTNIDMRYKCNNGVENSTIHIEKNNGQIHDIMMATTPIRNLTLGGHLTTLDICGNCRYKVSERVSDITIGDLWNGKKVVPELWDNKESNLSSCILNTKKAKEIFDSIKNITKEEINEIKLPSNYKLKDFRNNFLKIDKLGLSKYINSIQKPKDCEYDIALCGGTLNYNFGATLTYYALYKYLEELGKKVIIIPPKAGADKNKSHIGNVFEKYCNIAPNYFSSGKPIKFNELSNIFLIGSDQTWRTSYVINKWKMTPWLDYVKHNKKKITYSVCYGTTNLEKAIETAPQYMDEMKRLISNFDHISHRTPESCDITKNEWDKDSVHTIDPVFIVNPKEYDKLIDESTIELPKNEYACFYTLRTKSDMYEFFHKLTKETNCEEIIIGNGSRNATIQKEKYPNEKFVNPILAQDWLKYIKNAKYVVTDSFHGICFCILFNIPFISLISDKDIRINWILGSTNLRDNYLKELDVDKAIEIINKPINHLHHLNDFIDYSKKWLNEKIEEIPFPSKPETFASAHGVSVCAIGKWEEQYLVEWVEHYKSLGFDNIIFYDNNEEGDDGQYKVLKPYIDEGFVIYHDWRGKTGNKVQRSAYSNCMENYREKYDWMAFFDVDEFLELVEHKTIKEFLCSNDKFNDFQGIMFNWLLMTDNDLVYNDGRPLKERFTTSKENEKNEIASKTIIKTNGALQKHVGSVHYPFVKRENVCTTDGYLYYNDSIKINGIKSLKQYNKGYIRHYKFKTIEETFIRIERGDCNPRKSYDNTIFSNRVRAQISDFFRINNVTDEKMNLIFERYPQEKKDILDLLLTHKLINKKKNDNQFRW